jgi:hypothetical protein
MPHRSWKPSYQSAIDWIQQAYNEKQKQIKPNAPDAK